MKTIGYVLKESESAKWKEPRMRHQAIVLSFVILIFAAIQLGSPAYGQTASQLSEIGSIAYLATVMDQYHDRYPVYDDVSSGGNHFVAFGQIPDQNAPVTVNGSSTESPHSGATCIQFTFINSGASTGKSGGWYMLNGQLSGQNPTPMPVFGTVADDGVNLTGATSLTFFARGQTGGENIQFFVAGVGRDPASGTPKTGYVPDSTPRIPPINTLVTLTTNWQLYTIDLTGVDMSYIQGGFAWFADAVNNPNGAVFYVDDIQYNLDPAHVTARLNEPHFIRSYTTEPLQPPQAPPVKNFDLALRNSAFTYDNAVALLAFLADGNPDSLRRAQLIGDAFVYAASHDRAYTDGRVRSDYAAGDISLPPGWTPNNLPGTVSIPGYYDEPTQKFNEIGQSWIDTGDNAWTMIALTALYNRTGNAAYLSAATRIGMFIRMFRDDNPSDAYQGFQGGINFPEATLTSNPPQAYRPYASSEHNIDLYAAFTALAQATGDATWINDAQHAHEFVESMWDDALGCYLTGTTDPNTRNTLPNELPLDVQNWSILSYAGTQALHPSIFSTIEQTFAVTSDSFLGYDFNNDKDGVWFEGTAQTGDAYAYAGNESKAATIRSTLEQAQQTPPFGDGQGIAAASHDGITTGFTDLFGDSVLYFQRLHVGATAWNALAQLGADPYNLSAHVFPQGLQMISYPYSFGQDTLTTILGFANPVAAVWEPELSSYALTPNAPANSFRPGQGYWIRLSSTTPVNRYNTTPASPTQPFTISLSAGWNMIGDPFPNAVPAAGISVIAAGSTPVTLASAVQTGLVSSLYSYDSMTNAYIVLSMGLPVEPYVGYWIYAAKETLLVLSPGSSGGLHTYTYSYTGENFNDIFSGGDEDTIANRIAISLTFSEKLPNNGQVIVISQNGVSSSPDNSFIGAQNFSWTDGIHTVTKSDATWCYFTFMMSNGTIAQRTCQAFSGVQSNSGFDFGTGFGMVLFQGDYFTDDAATAPTGASGPPGMWISSPTLPLTSILASANCQG